MPKIGLATLSLFLWRGQLDAEVRYTTLPLLSQQANQVPKSNEIFGYEEHGENLRSHTKVCVRKG